MSIRVDSSSLIAGAVVVGSPGLGVLAEQVPTTGEHGGGIAATWLGPEDVGKEVRVLITVWPSAGSLTVFEDTSFEYDGPSTTFDAQLYIDGAAVGTPQTVTITVGLSSVAKTLAMDWRLNEEVTSSASVEFQILSAAARDMESRWAVLKQEYGSFEIPYAVYGYTELSADLLWVCLQDASLSNEFKWAVLASAAKELNLDWAIEAVFGVVTTNVGIRYRIYSAVASSTELRYQILSAVAKDSDLSFSVLASILKSSSIAWQVFGSAVSDTTCIYRILSSVLSTSELRYNILSSASVEAALLWSLLESYSRDTDIRYLIDSAVGVVSSDISIRWSILSTVHAIFTVAHNILGSVDSSIEVKWNLLTAAAREIEVGFLSYGVVLADVVSSWDVFSTTSASIGIRWEIRTDQAEYVSGMVHTRSDEYLVYIRFTGNPNSIDPQHLQSFVHVDIQPVVKL
jgi:hypothetical protein